MITLFDRELLKKIRSEFPRAATDLNGRKRAFFDNGTGTLVLGKAAKAEAEARVDCSANVGAIFSESKEADAVILEGRKAVADLLNAPSPDCIVSGESATSLLFNLSYAIGKELTGKENVVTTEYEHYANISPWVELEERRKIEEVRFARLNTDEGTLDIEHLKSLIDSKTRVVTVTAASNAFGSKGPLGEIEKMAREVDAYFVVDAVHHVAHGPIDVKTIGCDFLVFSGYKLFSSHGSFLYGKKDCLESLSPYKVAPAPDHAPKKWEWGTRDQSMFSAMIGVADYLVWLARESNKSQSSRRKTSLRVAMEAIEEYETRLAEKVLAGFDGVKGLTDIPRLEVFGLTDLKRLNERDPTFSFKVKGVPDDEVVEHLWTKGAVAARAEDFYSRGLKSYGQKKMIRISLVHYNTPEEIAGFLRTMEEICRTK
jgi:cysteine desulfurase family protein (TIGR01976 family)